MKDCSCSLLGSGLLGSLLSGLLGRGLLSSGLLGLLGSRLLGLLGSGLLSGLGLLGLLGLRLLSLDLLGLGLLGGQLEAASSLLAGSSSGHNLLGDKHLLEGTGDEGTGLGGIDLVVGDDGLLDGGTGGALLVAEGLDGRDNHGGVGRVGGGLGDLLGLNGLGSSRHGEVCVVDGVRSESGSSKSQPRLHWLRRTELGAAV